MVTFRRVAALKALASALWGARKPGAPGIGERFRAVPRMLVQGFTGRYPHLNRFRILLVVAGLLFLISPVDRAAEILLPLLGLADDGLVIAWIAGALLAETETFLAWESESRLAKSKVVVGQVLE